MKIVTQDTLGWVPDWHELLAALREGHLRPRAVTKDVFIEGGSTLLSRSAAIKGIGIGVKSVTVTDANPEHGLPTVQGAMLVFEDVTGSLKAIVDNALITPWKTIADSVLGATFLARPHPETLLIVGAGTIARTLAMGYSTVFPSLKRIRIWNRTRARAEALVADLVQSGLKAEAWDGLETACLGADIISTATLSRSPVLAGAWIMPGTHVDLIGAFKADMREADDMLMRSGRLFVDSYDSTIEHIGEIMIPLRAGTISRDDIRGDLYDLVGGEAGRVSDQDITIFKNGGGAHLDLMTAGYFGREPHQI